VFGFVHRAGAFAAVGSLALAAPLLGRLAALPFVAVGLAAAFLVSDGPLFELFERPGDREDGTLYGLAGFALAAAGLALLAAFSDLPTDVFVAAVLVLAYGNLGETVAGELTDSPALIVVGFGVGGTTGGVAGMVAVAALGPATLPALPMVAFLAVAGTLLAALLRSVLFARDDPLVMVSVALLLWFLAALTDAPSTAGIGVALAVTLALGWVSYALDTASVPGMLTGVFLGLLTLVLGGPGWFAVLIAFFGVGGLATKFRYEEKAERGVAEDNDGARGSGNVLGNSAVALLALLGYAGAPALAAPPEPFLFAFAGAVATAMSDTLSSEVGGVYDRPRLITTLEVVEPGTDGGVTWQGGLAGAAGAALVAALAFVAFPTVGAVGAATVLAAGVVGMNVDSVLGATLEGGTVGNQAVNFLATLSGALAGAAVYLLV
jgi:uncharacterized protein (TIGR00297 family)